MSFALHRYGSKAGFLADGFVLVVCLEVFRRFARKLPTPNMDGKILEAFMRSSWGPPPQRKQG